MNQQSTSNRPKIGILTISDRASRGDYEDLSGPAIQTVLTEYIATPVDMEIVVVPDEIPDITQAVEAFVAKGCALICSTGSTGPSPRDIMPEAMQNFCAKLLPGFGEQMRRASLDIGVPTAILSRQTAGILGQSLIVNLPGKPASIRVCLDAIFPAVPYCIDLIGGPFLEGTDQVEVFRPNKKK